jgi:hypothetical protein
MKFYAPRASLDAPTVTLEETVSYQQEPGPREGQANQRRRRKPHIFLRDISVATGRKVSEWLHKRRADNIAYTWLTIPVLCVLTYWVGSFFAWLSWGKQQEWQRWWTETLINRYLFPQDVDSLWDIPRAVMYGTGWFWGYCVGAAIVSMLVWWGMRPDQEHTSKLRESLFHGFMSLVLLGSLFQFVASLWEDDKDAARFNSQRTTYVVTDASKRPEQLTRQFEGVEPGDGKPCLFVSGRGGKTDDGKTIHDTPSCIVEGDLTFNWQDRNGSASGAKEILGRSGGGGSNTYLMEASLTYIPGRTAEEGYWSALKDGKNRQGMYQIVKLDRNNNVNSCPFTGQYKIKQAFSGDWSANFRGLLASRFPNLQLDDNDVWGYCVEGTNEPVLVLLPTKFDAKNARSMLVPGGVVTVRGSPSGHPIMKHYKNVGPDRKVDDLVLPGPVYPSTVAKAQREASQWTAGRKWKNSGFGFDPVPEDDAIQGGNSSEHHRRAINPDGSFAGDFWDTRMTPRGNDARTYVAYATIRSDTVTAGQFNELRIYVFNDRDPNDPAKNNPEIVNLDDMSARIYEMIGAAVPGFLNAKGKVIEFLPRDNRTWIAFGEIQGRVKYRFEISTNVKIKPTIVDLDTGETLVGPSARTGNEVCFDPGQMTTQQAGGCIAAIGDELSKRKDTNPTVTTPTPSASGSPPPR